MAEKISRGPETLPLVWSEGPHSPRPEKALGRTREWLPLALGVGAPSLLWALLFVAVPPAQQNFPLNDDNYYSRTAVQFAHGDGLDYFHHASMPMLGLLVWVSPFVWAFGDSHATLRVATMILGALGLIAYFDLLRREVHVAAWPAAATVACLGLGPLYFLLGSMFHTDIPALSFSLLALACFCRGLRGRQLAWWLGGMVLALFAVGTRQNAIAAPAAAGILLLFRRPETWLNLLRVVLRGPLWLLGLIVPVREALQSRAVSLWGILQDLLWILGAALPGYVAIEVHHWFNARPDAQQFDTFVTTSPATFDSLFQKMVLPTLGKFENLLYVSIHAIGLYALPLLLLPARFSKRVLGVAVVILIFVAFRFTVDMPKMDNDYNELAPYVRNCLTIYGQFWNGTLFQGNRPLIVTQSMQWGLTILGCVGGGLVVARVSARMRELVSQPLFLFTVFHLLLLSVCPFAFDRYFVVLFPGGLAAATGGPVGPRRACAVVAALLVFAVLAFATVRDLLTWNSAVWELGRRAEARGTNPEDIEGGFGWNGWHSPTEDPEKDEKEPRRLTMPFTRRYFPNVEGRYAISFTVLPATRVLDRTPYQLWLAPGEREMFFLEPDPGSPLLTSAGTIGFLLSPSGQNPLLAAAVLDPARFSPPAPP